MNMADLQKRVPKSRVSLQATVAVNSKFSPIHRKHDKLCIQIISLLSKLIVWQMTKMFNSKIFCNTFSLKSNVKSHVAQFIKKRSYLFPKLLSKKCRSMMHYFIVQRRKANVKFLARLAFSLLKPRSCNTFQDQNNNNNKKNECCKISFQIKVSRVPKP